ncbi:MAG TPA: PLP-dependent aminotransferase family protein, partial [Ancylobacter sp.]
TQAARDDLVAGLRSGEGGLTVAVPDQGLHLIARLTTKASDIDIVRAANAAGLGARALSAMYLSQPPQQGLVIGFSGFSGEELRLAAGRLAAMI